MGRNLKDTFLSIDLDYWQSVTPTMMTFLRKVLKLKVPRLLCKSHEQMLRFVNQQNTLNLVNVDYHADLCDDEPDGSLPEIDCGTWVNSVVWREKGTFLWVCPHKRKCYRDGLGRCDSYRNAETDPFKNKNNGWKMARVRTGLKYVNLRRVAAVGVALSPEYLDWNEEHVTPIRLEVRNKNFLKLKTVLPKLPYSWLEDIHSTGRVLSIN